MDGHFLRLPVGLERLNPLKRVKFISIDHLCLSSLHKGTLSLNPLKRVKFISIQPIWLGSDHFYRLNPLKRVKFISMKRLTFTHDEVLFIVSIPSNGSSLFQFYRTLGIGILFRDMMSQSPQTCQVYFNKLRLSMENSLFQKKSQSPQTGQVYFNNYQCTLRLINCILSQSPQTGQVYFNFIQHWHKPIANVKKVSIPSNGSSLFQFR